MKGDFTRLTYDPVKHYSSVRLQQGRVLLDADWNEELDILTHRIETEAIDVIGACGVPKHHPGFALSTDTSTVSANDQARLIAKGVWPLKAGDFLIGAGRAYVDGILCENDQLITFTSQDDLPGVQPIQAGGTYVAYLDVWQRHLTALEDPAIREVALGGPDTTTRTKTVWQVKLLPAGEDGSNVSCADETQWPAASTGKVSARTEPVPPEDDPCIVPPGAGYRRLENQLYRIEIHRGSDETGGPTFKWSRDNGSIVVAVEEFNANGDAKQVQVKSLGRDDVLGLHKFDWVEVSDDASELSGQHGTLAQILDIDTEHRVLILDTSISGYDLNGHAKVRRWDSAGELTVEVAADNDGYLKIEDGVEIKFDMQHFNVGDYWLIPARTVPGQYGDIEWPRDSGNNPIALLPLGIQHHYCKLGILTVTGAEENVDITQIEDCRQIFPPLTELPVGGECCCTVSVGDGVHSQGDYTDIQTAIDALPQDGGQVCIQSGVYTLEQTVVLRSKQNVTLMGCGDRSVVIGPTNGPVFLIEGGQNIEVNSLSIRGQAEPAAILARKISELRILNCTVINRGRKEARALAAFGNALPAIAVVGGLVVEIKHNRIGGLPAIVALARGLQIEDNLLRYGGIWIRSSSGDV
ncbi:MAG TPA: DUF6519 domain-containing protein, partial [Anaerolineae bacterium]|nr:DUF6519 domain-containing protein [Anaerolineae bacterium]